MAMATCVFTCSSWFSISSTSCLSIFSGSAALSIRSLRLARRRVVTRSISAMAFILSFTGWVLTSRRVVPIAVCVRFHLFHVCHQVRHLHPAERFKQSRDLGGYLGHLAGELVRTDTSVAGGDDGDLIHLRQRFRHGADHISQVGDELVDHRGLRPLLVSL